MVKSAGRESGIMTIWKVLEISPTKDIKEIKKAYAAQLRLIQIDQNPELFQELKEAFDYALGYARDYENASNVYKVDKIKIDNQVELENISISDKTGNNQLSSRETEQDSETSEEFNIKLSKILDNFQFFIDISWWKNLLSNKHTWNIEAEIYNQRMIVVVLLQHYRIMPGNIILFLLENFDLNEGRIDIDSEDEVYKEFIKSYDLIVNISKFSSDELISLPDDDRINFCYLRCQLYILMKSNHQSKKELKNIFAKASEYYDHDADLNIIYALALFPFNIKKFKKRKIKIKEIASHVKNAIKNNPLNKPAMILNNLISILYKKKKNDDKKLLLVHGDVAYIPIELINFIKVLQYQYTKKIDLALKYYYKCSYNYKRIGLQKLVKKYKYMSERNKYLYILELNKMFGKDASFAIQYRTEIIIFSIVCILIIIFLSRSNLILDVP